MNLLYQLSIFLQANDYSYPYIFVKHQRLQRILKQFFCIIGLVKMFTSQINLQLQIFAIKLIFYIKKYRMQPETSKSDRTKKLEEKKRFQNTWPALSTSLSSQEDENIQNKVDLQLYFHFQQMLPKSKYHYGKKSQFFYQRLSRQKVVSETIKYMNYLKENVKMVSPQNNQQLLFLVDIYNKSSDLITNWNFIAAGYKGSSSSAKFFLGFDSIKKRIDLRKFSSFNNWSHLVELSFCWCEWFDDDAWRVLVEHAYNFKNLKKLWLRLNQISVIREGDIEHFESLNRLDFGNFLIKTIDQQSSKQIEQRSSYQTQTKEQQNENQFQMNDA